MLSAPIGLGHARAGRRSWSKTSSRHDGDAMTTATRPQASTEPPPGSVPAVVAGTRLAPVGDSLRKDVSFVSDGLTLAGHLYRPPGLEDDVQTPALVMAGPMTSVKEETLPHYAAPLAEA